MEESELKGIASLFLENPCYDLWHFRRALDYCGDNILGKFLESVVEGKPSFNSRHGNQLWNDLIDYYLQDAANLERLDILGAELEQLVENQRVKEELPQSLDPNYTFALEALPII